MNADATGLPALMQGHLSLQLALMLVGLCSVRVFAMCLVLPATGEQALQGPVRNGVCLCIGTFIAWGQPSLTLSQLTMGHLMVLVGKEALLGVLLGYAASVVFWIAESVGILVDNAAGFNNVQQTNPLSGQQSTPVGNLLGQLAICGFYLLGGMTVLAGLLFESFTWWPLMSKMPAAGAILEDFVRLFTGRYLESTVKVAAPVLLILVIIDLGIGFLGKTAEKLEPNNLAQPIKGTVALVLLSLLVAVFFEQARPMLALQSLTQEMALWAKAARP
jgi:type III secretion protein T